MKKIAFIVMAFVQVISYAQELPTDTIIKRILEGVELHDDGKFEAAIKKYDEVLASDSTHIDALFEKAVSMYSQGRYEEVIGISQFAIDTNPDSLVLRQVYNIYGDALDEQGKFDVAITVYDEGLLKFPKYYMLHFNKGVSLYRTKKNQEARDCFKRSVELNPLHRSSYYQLGILESEFGNRISSILTCAFFLCLETKGSRAKGLFPAFTDVSINLFKEENGNVVSSAPARIDTFPDVFEDVEKSLRIEAIANGIPDFPEKEKKKIVLLQSQLTKIIKQLQTKKSGKKDFYWSVMAQFFSDLERAGYMEIFIYDIAEESGFEIVKKYNKKRKEEFATYYKWFNAYEFVKE